MKSTAVELPDPLDPPNAGPPGRADDLLAQMAGDEINRLLADAQVESEPPATVPAEPETHASAMSNDVLDLPGEMNDAPVPQETISKELDHVFARQVSATGDEPATSTSANYADRAQSDAMSADGVSDLLGQLSAGERNEAPGFAGAGTSVPVKQSDGSHPSVADGSASHDAASTDTKPNALIQSVATFAPHTGAEVSAPGVIGEVHPLASEPHSSRILDWMMFPLDPFPDHIRDVIGKIAIMTAINAAAVLLYVLVFRR